MSQIARNITDCYEPMLPRAKYLIMDRDSLFTKKFKRYLKDFGIRPIILPKQSPDLNAFAERFVLSIKSECLNRLILWSWRSLNYVVKEYIEFYNHERPHQGINNQIPFPENFSSSGEIKKKSRLGGLLNYYYRAAA